MVTVPDRRRSAVVLLVAVTAVTTAMLVPVLSSHLAVARTDQVSTTAPDATVPSDGERVRVTLRVENPTTAAVVVRERPSESGLALFDGDERTTRSRGIAVSGARVPPGGTSRLTLTLAVAADHQPLTRDAVRGTTLSGSLPVEIAGYETEIDVEATVGAA